jgi:hypothetical protein
MEIGWTDVGSGGISQLKWDVDGFSYFHWFSVILFSIIIADKVKETGKSILRDDIKFKNSTVYRIIRDEQNKYRIS